MSEQKIIKTIIPEFCPHCGEKIYIGSQSMPLNVTSISKESDILEVKGKIKERLNDITFNNESEKVKIEHWLSLKTTFLDASDIEPLIIQISREQVEMLATKQEIENENKNNNDKQEKNANSN